MLLPQREVHAEIGINWVLDQDILSHPKERYVRILAESVLWEKTRIRTIEGLNTCMEPHRKWTLANSSWNLLRKRWLNREQELVTVIHLRRNKRTKEKMEAGYRSPTWSILRALQKINTAKRLEGEAVISAPPFFQSAGRGDLKIWGKDDEPTVAVWESLLESEQKHWSKKMDKSKDWVVWCRSRKIDEEQRPFEADRKEIFSNLSNQAKDKAGEILRRWIRKEAKCSQCTGKRGGDRVTSNAQ